jgi:hypothetical protein
MWEVEYELPAANYLFDNGSLVSKLFFAMEALAESEGFPSSGVIELGDGVLAALLEGHLVYFERYEDRQVISIIAIQPS